MLVCSGRKMSNKCAVCNQRFYEGEKVLCPFCLNRKLKEIEDKIEEIRNSLESNNHPF